jgi:hypothetical protein
MNKKPDNRIIVGCDLTVAAPAGDIFPLLCPVREYDWIEGWRCEMIFSDSGVAENNCIFATDRPGEGKRTWVVSRYEPPKAIEFVIFQENAVVIRLDLYLSANGDGKTRLRVTHTITALNEDGIAVMQHVEPEAIRNRWQALERALNHYLADGSMLSGA